MAIELSAADARRLAVVAQSLTGRRHSDPRRLLRSLAAIQLDTISVLARSHELVCFARLGPISRDAVSAAFWGPRSGVFEYWAHAACLLPVELWPWLAWRRRRSGERWLRSSEPDRESHRDEVLRRLRDLGPITTADLDGARRAPGWWEWSPLKRAVEELLGSGDVVCVERRGWRRVYDLPERALSAELLNTDHDDIACTQALVSVAIRAMGVATVDDIADYFRLPVAWVRSALPESGLEEVSVEGWGRPAWAAPDMVAAASRRVAHRPVLLSPFDSLIWHRPRTQRLFDFRHRLEAYTPADQREHGYFVMPLLAGSRLVGRVDPKRDGETLVARQVSAPPAAIPALAAALRDAAAWVDCSHVAVGDAVKPEVALPLRAELALLGCS